MKQLLEAGVHFGHQTRRWNPKMKEYIFGERSGIYIVDLQKTHRLLQEALQYVQELAAQGKSILFVGTKRQAQEAIAEEAQRCGMPFVNERWLGGLLTNFVTVRKSLDRMKELEMVANDPRQERLTKKELARLEKERLKLEKNLLGIKGMKSVPTRSSSSTPARRPSPSRRRASSRSRWWGSWTRTATRTRWTT